jgi:hypothetical protein
VQVAERISEALSHVGPSMTLASCSESLAFFLGVLIDVPAVKTFSGSSLLSVCCYINKFLVYAGVAVLCNYLLQVTCFVSMMALDATRTEALISTQTEGIFTIRIRKFVTFEAKKEQGCTPFICSEILCTNSPASFHQSICGM